MSNEIEKLNADEEAICALVCGGDASKLTPDQRTQYYLMRCKTAGLDPRAQPFQFMSLQGKLILYATKACTDQLASSHSIRVEVVSQETTPDGIRVVTVRAIAKDGRQTDEIGCVSIKAKSGDDLANAYMKSVTKAKRRAILSLCGLGCSDETELEIPGAQVVPIEPPKEMKRPQAAKAEPQKTVVTTIEATKAAPAQQAAVNEALDTSTGEVVENFDSEGGQEEPLEDLKVSAVTFKEPTKAGAKRTYFITGSDQRIYYTQTESVAQDAQIAKDENRFIVMKNDPKPTSNRGKDYYRITELSVIQ